MCIIAQDHFTTRTDQMITDDSRSDIYVNHVFGGLLWLFTAVFKKVGTPKIEPIYKTRHNKTLD